MIKIIQRIAAILTFSAVTALIMGATPLDASDCVFRCWDCQRKNCTGNPGKARDDCEQNCVNIFSSCCEANGKKPVYRQCGCY
jgi:hypothetical protein